MQVAIFVGSGVVAFLLRFDFTLPAVERAHLLTGLCAWALAKTASFHLLHLGHGWWRYFSLSDLMRVLSGNALGSLLGGLAILAVSPGGFPRSIYMIDLIVCFLGTTGIRVIARSINEGSSTPRCATSGKPTLVYGAGAAGIILAREIRHNPDLHYRIVGFLDDCLDKRGFRLAGVPVLGAGCDAASIVKKMHIEIILIAIPSATGSEMTRILETCHTAGIECKTVPGLADVIQGRELVGQIREVAVEDLLGRNAVRLDEGRICRALQRRMVLVTGAAGSIGSELCRQIASFDPAGIVGLDSAESQLFEIDLEMRKTFPHIPFHAEIGSIQHRARLAEILDHYKPAVVYHAAAYKHVPLMESHVFEAVENNVFGTYNVALAASEHGAEDFVMISSDKAVRPTNIMGATKRVAELLLRTLQNGRTKFVAVRFGNVLGSNGSVIPIFKSQIAAGGPVTVTHPEMRRFFMTIPEACQLVLQAAVIGEGGQICVLDMGEPVKIVDLARKLIVLSGLRPDEDIKIQFTGIRPGEKLFEELSTILEDTVPTSHEKIRIFVGTGALEEDALIWLERLREICEARDVGRLVVALKEIVLDYSPSAHLLRRIVEKPPSSVFVPTLNC